MSWFTRLLGIETETHEAAAERKRRRGADTEAGSYNLDALFDLGSSYDGGGHDGGGDCGSSDAGGCDGGGGDGGGGGE